MALMHKELTGKIPSGCFEVINELGAGFLESVYEEALVITLRDKNIHVIAKAPIDMQFRGMLVGQF